MSPFPPEPLPPRLIVAPFTVAEARDDGLTPDRLRARDLDSRVHGVRAAAGSADDLRLRCRMFAARLPVESFVSHSTAARLIGAPLPSRFERLSRLHISVEAPARAPHATGLIGHSRHLIPGDIVVDSDGLRRSSAERIVCEMSTVLRLDDLVALIDYVIHHAAPWASLDTIASRLEVGDRITRARILRPALGLADPRSESRPESRLRVLLVTSGLTGWHANYEVVDSSTGSRYRIDLALPEAKVGLEYQGGHHWTVEQRRLDMTRRARLEADGWRIMEINADDLANPVELVARVRRFLAR